MKTQSLARELALLVLGQVSETDNSQADLSTFDLEMLLQKALDSLTQHWRELLDLSANQLETAHQELLDSELDDSSIVCIREHLKSALVDAEKVLNGLSGGLEFPRLLVMADQESIRIGAIQRVKLVVKSITQIDTRLDSVMEGWRLRRLPRIDRDILRLAVVDLIDLETPAAVACNEAVELANRYSDEQGRRMINGVLRRLQDSFSVPIA